MAFEAYRHDVAHLSMRGARKTMGTKGDPIMPPGTCGAIGERAHVILVWLRAPDVENASHSRKLEVIRVRP